MRIAVAMSGGVDSSVAAAVLKAQGHDVVGLTMKLWVCSAANPDQAEHEADLAKRTRGDVCCSPEDVQDAKDVCASLGVPHYVLEMAEDFDRQVIDQFIDDYARARTPNPCVRCNERVKSKGLLNKARALGCERLATGHYARIDTDPRTGKYRLRTGLDSSKDQSYFLFPLTQEELACFHFPLGEVPKQEVRRVAQQLGLNVADKRESNEVCFITDNDHGRFLRERVPDLFKPGPVVFVDGRIIGEHQGLIGYTIGQRKGLGVAWTEPLYVVRLDQATNTVVLGPDPALYASGLEARDMHWISGEPVSGTAKTSAKIRYRTPASACTVEAEATGKALLRFDEPVRAVTPGQAVVLYDGDVVLGGGWIERALASQNMSEEKP